MPKNALWTFSPSDYAIYTSAAGVALPTGLPTGSTLATSGLGTGWYDVGLASDAGTGESHTFNENKIYDMKGSLVRIVRNQEERPFTFECLQYDAVVAGLKWPGTSVTVTGATAEVQTLTITGTPAGGTFTPSLAGFPAVPPQPYNVATAALQTVLQNAWDVNVTVTGTAGTSYVVTFPAGEGNVSQMTVSAAFTGGTSPAASFATTTPGVTGVNTRAVGSGLVRNLRQWVLDLFDATTIIRKVFTYGEAIWTGTSTDSQSGIEITQFNLNPFVDANSNFYTIIDNAPGMGISFA